MKKIILNIITTILIVFVVSNILNFIRADKPDVDIKKVLNQNPQIIYFWGDWCPICKLEKSQIKQISKDLKVLKIAVNSKKHEDSINDDGRLASTFLVKAYPTIYYIIDGKILYSDVGFTSSISIKIKYALLSFFY